MLQLRSGRPEPKAVMLAGGASVRVRAATTFEADLALARAAKLLAGLIQSAESAALVVDLLGEEFTSADFTLPEWIDAAGKRILLIELAEICIVEWTGFVDADGRIIDKPSRPMLALLLRSMPAARLIENAIRAEVNAEFDEKNVLAASPTGAAAADEPIAPSAEPPAPDARTVS